MNIQVLKSYLERVCGEPLAEVGGIATDWARYYRHENLYRIFERWERFCSERGIVPNQTIAPSLLLPILEAASYVDDENLQELWARLIASGTDSGGVALHPTFVEILKRITPAEALLLQSLYQEGTEDLFRTMRMENPRFGQYWGQSAISELWRSFCDKQGVTESEADTYLDNLTQLYVIRRSEERRPDPFAKGNDQMKRGSDRVIYKLQFTALGRQLMEAVRTDPHSDDIGTR